MLTEVLEGHLPRLAHIVNPQGSRRLREKTRRSLMQKRAALRAEIEHALQHRVKEHQALLLHDTVGVDDCLDLCVASAVDHEKWLRAQERIQAQVAVLEHQARQLTALKVHLGQASVIAAALDRILSLVSSPEAVSEAKRAFVKKDYNIVHRFLQTLRATTAAPDAGTHRTHRSTSPAPERTAGQGQHPNGGTSQTAATEEATPASTANTASSAKAETAARSDAVPPNGKRRSPVHTANCKRAASSSSSASSPPSSPPAPASPSSPPPSLPVEEKNGINKCKTIDTSGGLTAS